MTRTDLNMANGDRLTVEGTLEEVEKTLSDAARSGQARLAWFTDPDTDKPVGVNPAHVSTVRVSGGSD